jgi:hypothetical protein
MMRYTILLSALLLAAAESHAHDGHPASHKIKAQMGSSAAFDSHGTLWLVSRDDAGDEGYLVARKSKDNGKTWSSPAIISREPVVASGDERPHIAFGQHDEVYVTYSSPLDKPWTSEVRFIRSEDGGLHFSAPYTVHHDHQTVTHGFASLAVDANGLVYVTWIDKRNPQNVAQYYAVSANAGQSFDADYKIADHSCECCRSAIALGPGGHPALMWRQVFAPNIRDHAIAELTPDGKQVQIERASFDNWAIDACPHQGPSLAFGDDGRRHQTWFTNDGIFYASQNQDGTLTKPMRLGSEQAAYADVTASGQHVEAVWRQFDGKGSSVMAASSHDGGTTWQTRTLASTNGASDQPRLARKGARIFLVWRTELNDVTTVQL